MNLKQVGFVLFKTRWRRLVYFIIVIVLLVWGYLLFTSYWAYTSDAYINADHTTINARVDGYVQHIYVNDYQKVNKNEPLFSIAPQPYRLKLKQSQAQLSSAKQALRQAKSQIQVDKAKQYLAKQSLQHYRKLTKQDNDKQQTVDKEHNHLPIKKKELDLAQQILKTDQLKLKSQRSTLKKTQVNVALARYQLKQTQLKAPYAGYITKLRIGEGTYLRQGDDAFAIVKQGSWYVMANIKESCLRSINMGDIAYIHTNTYGWLNWLKGHVVNISPAISRKAQKQQPTIPYVKPRLNWIRLERRFPVKIKIDNPPDQPPLRLGANARVLISKY